MANRYWAAGVSGNWNNTASWSSSATGTPAGASVPGSSDAAIFNAASGTVTATLDISPTVQTLTMTGFTGTLAFGTNTISLNSTGTIFTGATTMTVTGTPQIICTNATATARTITPAAVTEANSISFRVTAGTGVFTITTGAVRDLDFTDGTNPTGYAGAAQNMVPTIYGNFKASTGMTKVAGTGTFTFAATSGTKTINTAGVTFDNPFTFNGVGGTWQLQTALTSGATRATTLTSGTLDLVSYTLTTGTFSSNTSTTRTLAFGTGKIVVTGNTATVCTTNTATNLTVTGSRRVEFSTASTTGTRAISGPTIATAIEGTNLLDYYVISGGDTVTFTSSRAYGTIDFYNAGASTFTGTFANATLLLYGDLAVKSGMTIGSGALVTTFQATSGTKTITSNGQGLDFPITINGAGGTFQLADALNMAATSRTFTLTAGTFNTSGYALSVGAFTSSNTSVRAMNLGASAVTITAAAAAWSILDATNLTFNAGTSTITYTNTLASCTFTGGGQTYYNIVSPDSAYSFIMAAIPVINQLTLLNTATAGTKTARTDGNQVIGTLTMTGANGNCRILYFTTPTGTQYTITAASVSLVDADFRDIAAAGASIPWTGTRLGNIGNTANITFAAGKTVYWNKAAGGYWGDDAWATVSGGATSTLNQPLGQDMAVFDNAGLTAGSTVLANAYLTGGLNCSTLTNALILQSDGTYTGFSLARNVTLSSAVSFAGTFNITLNGRTATQYITSAGVNWSCGVSIQPLATIVLVDDLNADDISFTLGPIDLNGKAIICNTFAASSTSTRSIAFNGGKIDVTGNNATVWSAADLTGFSYTGTPTVNFTYSGSTGIRTIANGNTAGATESNVVDINVAAATDTFTFSTSSSFRNLIFTGFTGLTTLGNSSSIYGNVTLSAGLTISAGTGLSTFAATSGTKTITTNGVVIDRPLLFNGIGGTWALQDALTLGATNGTLTLTNGTLNSNGFNVAALNFALGAGTKTLTMGASTWSISGNWDALTNGAGFTVNAGTSTINMSSASSKSFSGNSKTYYNFAQTGLGTLSISGSNTFNNISNTVQPTTLSFEAASTQTVNGFSVSGTAGNLVTLNSLTPGTRWNLAKNTGGKVLVSYDSITDSAASPAGYWFAPTSQGNVNGGNNTGWNFASAGGAGGFLPFF